MTSRAEQRKAALVEQVRDLVETSLPPGQAELARRFADLFCRGIPPEDLADERAGDLHGAAVGLFRFAAERQPGLPKIRVFNPTPDEHGWRTGHTVVEIVNDDMPFLVDSVTAAIAEEGLVVHLVVHPVAAVKRDAAGRLTGLWPVADAPAGAVRESLMHVQVDQRTEPATLEALRSRLAAMLHDVRAAVEDWPQMRLRARDLAAAIEANRPPVPEEEAAEAVALLRWMDDDNFTFLGYREYGFTGAGSALDLAILPDSGLGVLRDPAFSVFEGQRQYAALSAEIQDFMRQPQLVLISKAGRRATVHRPVPLDVVIVKTFDAQGQVAGERMFVGLFTSVAYSRSAREIPILRGKIARTLARVGFDPRSHDGKALTHILDTYPRDELFQIDDETLFEIAIGILHLQDRQKTGLFVRRDPYGRFVSCLIYVPRDRYSTEVRLRLQAILEEAYGGPVTSVTTQMTEGVHARVHLLVATPPGRATAVDTGEVERQLAEASRSWADALQTALVEAKGEELGLTLWRRYGNAFPTSYREQTAPDAAIADLDRIVQVAEGAPIALSLYRPVGMDDRRARFKLFRAGTPVSLSGVLPMLEEMGFLVIGETPHAVRPSGSGAVPIWLHDFEVESRDGSVIDIGRVRQPFHEAFQRVWQGEMENDGFNRLVLGAGLDWRQVVVLRAYAKYLRQARLPFSQEAIEDTLASHPAIARLLVQLFERRLDPAREAGRSDAATALNAELEQSLEAVENLDEDRILRRMINLVRVTLRTNFYQRTAAGGPKPYLSLKLDSGAIDDLPLPRPWREIFVYSPRVEAVHLRGGRVARGGIRWSDRREDFRTEILGLMKAQMVKNAVIVPVGSKGGFVVKRPPREGGREAMQAEGIECYRTMMRGLLDITDNLAGGKVVPPADVVRCDGDDPYLVVAADKGTAAFSDIANAISLEYGYWLGDAFASGGSAGYDHKKMGITARGAWESVKRHFREIDLDIQAQDFTVVGVGDMSGDVFGNAMLLSRHIRLFGAFNHLHIFADPDPDAAASLAERERLFKLGRGSWDQYDAALLSPGGAVFDRRAKALKLSPQIRARFGIEAETVTPAQLICAMLRAPVDLLWFGGIGTFIKAHDESNVEVGDKSNDALRIDGRDVRAKIIGEGANLAVTQRGRIEFAQAGGRLNTDFIDNSAGVDTSDHEVNIKILLDQEIAGGDMTLKQRDALLTRMTDEVAQLVLRDNYLQSQALSLAEAEAPKRLDEQTRLMRVLERQGRLNRAVELLPNDEELAERASRRQGLTRPELAVLLSYGKIALYEEILASGLPDDPALRGDLALYFPAPIRQHHEAGIANHPLHREIIATSVTNNLVNRAGPTFVMEMRDKTGMGPEDIARAFLIVRDSFRLEAEWQEIEQLDTIVPAAEQTRMMLLVGRLVERATAWVLRHRASDLEIAGAVRQYGPGLAQLSGLIEELVHPDVRDLLARRVATMTGHGVPEPLARRIAAINLQTAGLDLISISGAAGTDLKTTGAVYFELGRRLGLAFLRDRAAAIPTTSHWQSQAVAAIVEDLYALQADLALRVLGQEGGAAEPAGIIERWIERRRQPVERIEQLMSELKQQDPLDIAMLAVANRRLRGLMAG